jgi:hypothetical protein
LLFGKLTTNSPCPTFKDLLKASSTPANAKSFQRHNPTIMTLYFRRYKIRNPLKPRSLAYLETVLAAETAAKEKIEKAARRAEKHHVRILFDSPSCRTNIVQRKSLAKLEGREDAWQRAIRLLRGFGHTVRDLWRHSPGEPEETDEEMAENEQGEGEDREEVDEVEDDDDDDNDAESQSEEEWDGDWMAVVEDDE